LAVFAGQLPATALFLNNEGKYIQQIPRRQHSKKRSHNSQPTAVPELQSSLSARHSIPFVRTLFRTKQVAHLGSIVLNYHPGAKMTEINASGKKILQPAGEDKPGMA
jgi:hypothetical protein